MKPGPPRLILDKEWLNRMVDIDVSTGCWNFRNRSSPSTKPSRNYGRYDSGGKSYLAHRKAFELYNGEIPHGMIVCHHCDNPKCCNPNHLFLGTFKDNIQDALKKGRLPSGPDSALSKLNRDQVLSIRADPRSTRELAAAFGVHHSSIHSLKSGKTYSSVY